MQNIQDNKQAVLVADGTDCSDNRDRVNALIPIIFKLLWQRDEDFRRLLLAHSPRRSQQEAFFRRKGHNCKYYRALCHTIALDTVEGKIHPNVVEFLNDRLTMAS